MCWILRLQKITGAVRDLHSQGGSLISRSLALALLVLVSCCRAVRQSARRVGLRRREQSKIAKAGSFEALIGASFVPPICLISASRCAGRLFRNELFR